MFRSSFFEFCLISSIIWNFCPLRTTFNFRNKKKLAAGRSGKQGAWSTIAVECFAKKSSIRRTSAQVCCRSFFLPRLASGLFPLADAEKRPNKIVFSASFHEEQICDGQPPSSLKPLSSLDWFSFDFDARNMAQPTEVTAFLLQHRCYLLRFQPLW